MSSFLFGFIHPFRCFGLFLKYPKIILYSIVPMIINLAIYGTILFLVYGWVTGYADDLEFFSKSGNIFLEMLKLLMQAAVFLLVLLLCYFLFIVFGGLVSAPFNEYISKYIEEKKYGVRIISELTFTQEVLLSLKEETKKLLFYFSVILPLFVINFIPMIGSTISFVIGVPFSSYYNALDFMDYPMTRSGYRFRQKLRTINSKPALSLGFGAMAFILTFLPVVNALLKPLLVVSGTSLFYEKNYFDAHTK